MSYTQHFIIGDKYYGNTTRTFPIIPNRTNNPLSYIFYCIKCGEIYAKCPSTKDSKQAPYLALRHLCEKCNSDTKYEVPGSLWTSYDEDFLNNLPIEVLLREFELHIKHFKKYGNITP